MMLRTHEQSLQTMRHRAHVSAVAWATKMVKHRDLLFLDTETTGLDATAEVVEIAIVDRQGRVLLDTLVRPQGRIPADAARIHGIDDAMVRNAPTWPHIYPMLTALLAGRDVIVYNAAFDFRLVNQMNRRYGLPQIERTWQCAMLQYADYVGEPHARYNNFRWHKLDVAVTCFGHAPGGHRARADADSCRHVVFGMAGTRE